MVSPYWSNIDPESRLLARFYPMRMKPSWIVSLDCISAQQHKFTHKYGECFYWVEQQNEFAWKIYAVCFHVGQMLFAGNKYLLLKRITVQCALSFKGIVRSEPRIQQSLSTIPRDNLFKVLYFVDMDTVVHTSGRSIYQMCSWTSKLFKVRKYENSCVHSAIANQQIANPQFHD